MEWEKWLLVGILIAMLISVWVLFIKEIRWNRKTEWMWKRNRKDGDGE